MMIICRLCSGIDLLLASDSTHKRKHLLQLASPLLTFVFHPTTMNAVHIINENQELEREYQRLGNELVKKSEKLVYEENLKTKAGVEANKKPRCSIETKIIDHSIY